MRSGHARREVSADSDSDDPMTARLPEHGRPWDDLSREMTDLKRDDLDWRRGRHAAFVWHADDAVERVAREAYALFMTENGLGLRVFPSLRRMESDVVAMVAGLVGGDDAVRGHMTSGGTESIFLAAQLGYPVPAFGLDLPGVASLSADLHKSGYAAKGASVILYRDAAREACGRYEFSDWPTGLYAVPTFAGTRPGGAIAAAWAVMHFLGAEGYRQIARTVMQARERLLAGLAKIDGLHPWGEPDLWAVAYGTEDYDIHAVADAMSARRWSVGRVRTPPGIHLMLTPVHAPVVDDYLADLAASVAAVRGGAGTPSRTPVVY
jgi:glutamate/tyrosine decarboxylase-like PLP-dependent enzyme